MMRVSWRLPRCLRQRRNPPPAASDVGSVLQGALRDGLGADYADVAATLQAAPSVAARASAWRTAWSRRRYVDKRHPVRYGPHRRANLADIWRRRDLPP